MLVIVDGGPDNRDCDAVLAVVHGYRRSSGGDLPRVILLSTRINPGDRLPFAYLIDAVVAKPITSDRLQPVVQRLVRSAVTAN